MMKMQILINYSTKLRVGLLKVYHKYKKEGKKEKAFDAVIRSHRHSVRQEL